MPYQDRAARTDEALGLLRELVAGEPTEFPGGTELTLAPGAPPPPIWIGGKGAASRRRTAAYGDGWFPSMITPDEVAAGMAHLAELCAGRGRAETPSVAIGGSVLLGAAMPDGTLNRHVGALISRYGIPPNAAAQLPLAGSPAAVAERLQSYAAAGARHIVLGLISEDWRKQCDLLAEAIRLA